MAATERRYSKEAFARRGDALVESKVRPNLMAADEGKFVAIDIDTGEYELDKNKMRVADRLRKRVPEAQIWFVHVTLGYIHPCGASQDRRHHPGREALIRVTLRGFGGCEQEIDEVVLEPTQ